MYLKLISITLFYLGNACYTSPKCKLDYVKDTAHRIAEFESLSKIDLSSCYSQYPLDSDSQKQLAFEFGGVIYVPSVLTYGAAMNVFFVQSINMIPVEFLRSRFLLFIILYIDDFLCQKREKLGVAIPEFNIGAFDTFPLLSLLKILNFHIADHKTEQDRISLDFCGFHFNLNTKRISVKSSTVVKLKKKIEEGVISDRNNYSFIYTEQLESLLGLINFAASTSEFGLSRTLEILLNFNEARKQGARRVWITKGMQEELDYWLSLNPGDSLSFNRFNCLHAVFHIEGIQPNLLFTDASSSKYGFKVHGESGLISTGAGYFERYTEQKLISLGVVLPKNLDLKKEIINCKEMIGAFLGIDKLAWNSFYLALIDNLPVVQAILKTRSKNRLTNSILQRMFCMLKERNIFLKPVWINTLTMSIAGADDLSRSDYKSIASTIKFSAKGIDFFQRIMPDPLTMVFGNIVDAELYPSWKYASFHDEEDQNFVGVDPFVYLMKGFNENCLKGTQVIFPPSVMLGKTIELLEKIKHQKDCLFCLILPASKLMEAKLRLLDKVNLAFSKFQHSHKKTRLSISLRQDYFLLRFGSDLKKFPVIKPLVP